jgi:hypothetical protein
MLIPEGCFETRKSRRTYVFMLKPDRDLRAAELLSRSFSSCGPEATIGVRSKCYTTNDSCKADLEDV